MRLIALRLENFLAYHAPVELWLDTVNLAVLSGPNGAGKSSLLDAVTWALWGRARSNDDDALIHSGQTEMSVTVIFNQDGLRYEVTRHHSRGKPNKLFFYRYIDDKPEVLGNRLRETQATIDQLLRLNYDTFVNSAFLRQGEADLFTTSKPAERKQVLGRILELDRWIRFEIAAKERAKQIEIKLAGLKDTIERLTADLSQEGNLRVALDYAETAFLEAQARREAAELAYGTTRGAKAEAAQKAGQIDDLNTRITRDQRTLTNLEFAYQKQNEQIARAIEIMARQAEIEAGFSALGEARTQESQLREAQIQHEQINGQLKAARARLESDIVGNDREIKRLEKKIAEAQHAIESAALIEAQLAELQIIRQEREQYSAQLTVLRTESATLIERNKTLLAHMNEIKERLAILQSATEDADCPVCGQPLDEKHRISMAETHTHEGKAFGNEHRANAQRLKALEREIPTMQGALADCESELRQEPELMRRYGNTQMQNQSLQQFQAELESRLIEADMLRNRLATEDYGHEERVQRDAIGYDETVHKAIRAQIAELSPYEDGQRVLLRAIQELPELEQNQAETVRQATELQAQMESDQIRIDALKAEIEALADRVRLEQQSELEFQAARQAEWAARDTRISLQQQVKALEDVRRRLEEAQQNFVVQGEDYATYKQLAEAFGKNGIPALIIDAAIPEIEQEANHLLGRLTDHRLHIRLDTQKANKSGDVADTLTLQVSDESETRDYALYSGGEGFRIDFAVRMALSTLLARRAGAQLQTLFIDEGFGSQDANGRDRLLEAINAIRGQFDLILVVTHIDEMRDAFPVHLRVRKEANGSIVELTQN